ncbi:MAG: CPBP family intramembrane metalloprotease [Phycisphaerales bacterium]|nr:CPBP family intramembrane metalloprotease [Phycisphaerales bacterium]
MTSFSDPSHVPTPHSHPIASHPAAPTAQPLPARAPDPGTPLARTIALWILIVFFGLTFYLQQSDQAPASQPKTPGELRTINPPQSDPNLWIAKLAVKLSHIEGMAGQGPAPGIGLIPQLDAGAHSPEDRIRFAIVAADLEGSQAGITRLEQIRKDHPPALPIEPASDADSVPAVDPASESPPSPAVVEDGMRKESPQAEASEGSEAQVEPLHPELAKDIDALTAIFSGNGDQVADEQKVGLEKRHGWFGRLAETYGRPDTDPDRKALVGGGGVLMALMMAIGLGFLVVFLAGLGLLIYFIVRVATGTVRWRFDPPAKGGSVYLETAAVFIASFVLFRLITGVIAEVLTHTTGPDGVRVEVEMPASAGAVMISAQWLLVLPIFWPLVRGVSFSSMRKAIGWHSGRGVFREIGAGLVAYIAGIPVLVGAVIAAVVLMMLWELIKTTMGGSASPPPENPIIDLLGGSDTWTVIAFATLATLWAPIVEEAIFRGCMYRHARARVHMAIAAVVSALVFGGMHGYPGPLLLPVMSLGLIFALMREWRGSLIAAMTAHAVHNFTVTTILLTFVYLLKD